MGIIKDILSRATERKNKMREIQDNALIKRNFQERQLSPHERVFNKMMEEERQKAIRVGVRRLNEKRQLEEKRRSQQMMKFNPEIWKQNSILKQGRHVLQWH